MERIPHDVAEAVRAAARAAPGYPGDLADVHRRARRRRNRQAAVSAVAVLAVLAGGGAGMATWRGTASPAAPAAPAAPLPSPVPSIPQAEASPVQALILDDAAGFYRVPGGPVVELGADRQAGELRPDGVLAGHPVVGSRRWEKVAPLPDGGLVALGTHDTVPGAGQSVGPDLVAPEYHLVVTDPDGKVRIQRDLSRKGESVTLLTADPTTAYLWRPDGLVTHDLVTGAERVLVKGSAFPLGRDLGDLRHSDLSADRLAVAAMKNECLPQVLDLATGRLTAELPLEKSYCIALNRMRLSPDGTVLAVAYRYKDTGKHLPSAVALIRLSDGAVLARHDRVGMVDGVSLAVSLAWQDNRTLRGAEYPVRADGVSEVNGFTLTAR